MAARIATVESWTASVALATSPPPPRAATASPRALSIPLDAEEPPKHLQWAPSGPSPAVQTKRTEQHTVYGRREPVRRDSLARREALAKGKEGSRRRQRWENDRLLGVPGAVPPTASDWAVPCWQTREGYQPVPYFLAPLWDARYASLHKERVGQKKEEEDGKEKVAKELRARMKKSRGARGLLQDLEVEVRNFLVQMEKRRKEAEDDGLADARDESDDEIVFIGRNGTMSDQKQFKDGSEKMERLIFQSLERDQGAAFGRWLVHSIADYYGLDTWSITTGNPARREAYVGLKTGPAAMDGIELPRPLWVLV